MRYNLQREIVRGRLTEKLDNSNYDKNAYFMWYQGKKASTYLNFFYHHIQFFVFINITMICYSKNKMGHKK